MRLDGVQQMLRQRVLGVDAAADAERLDRAPLLIDSSPALANLIDRAREAADREDWKLVVDSLQRVIDDTTAALLPSEDGSVEDGMLFESSRRYARRLLSELPSDGLRAYRMVYDGRARGLLERARRTHDEALLRSVVDQYLLSSVGDEAADLLASWMLEEGRAGETLAVLADLTAFAVDHDIPAERIASKRAAAYAMLGRQEDATAVLAQYRDDSATEKPGDWLEALPERVADMQGPDVRADAAYAVVEGKAAPLTVNQAAAQVSPTLLADVPWRYELPGNPESPWQIADGDPDDGPPNFALGELVSDGERVFVRQRGGCVALWPDDLTPVWDAQLGDDDDAAVRQQRSLDARTLRHLGISDRTYEDDATNLIATAAGMVFVVEPGGQSEYTGSDVAGPQALEPAASVNAAGAALDGSRLVALDAETGEIRWQRGRSGEPADPLAEVYFSSVPIAVGENLWVPYFKRRDLYVAVLRPDDGSLLRNMLLGSVQEPNRLRRYATPLGVGEGQVYVPSVYGTLFALDASSFTLRWAAQYHRHSASTQRATERSSGWLPGAPVSAGGIVLLATPDYSELLAFAAGDGRFLWSQSLPEQSYILGVRDDRVWLAGRGATCVSVSDGAPIWHAQLDAPPTGRGVLAGDAVLLPTSEGLVELDAESGELRGTQALASNQAPLGNLLSLDPAVLSLAPRSVRRFPDLARSYELARARFDSNPDDIRAATQLAWAELLNGDARRACEITDRFVSALDQPGFRADSLRRVRLESLLEHAWGLGPVDEALNVLERAAETASEPDQRTRVSLATAEQLEAMGRALDAHDILFELGFARSAGRTVEIEDGIEVSVRFDVARRLASLHASLSPAQRADVVRGLEQRIDAALRRLRSDDPAARTELTVIAALDPVGVIGQRALLALGEYELGRTRFEWAEQYLRQCAKRSADPAMAAAAHLRLCTMYGPEHQGAPPLLESCLDALLTRHGDQPVPRGAQDGTVEAVPVPRQPRRIADWVAQQRAAFLPDPQPIGVGPPLEEGGVSQLTGERLWAYGFEPVTRKPRLVDFGTGSGVTGLDCLLLLGADDVLECLASRTMGDSDSGPQTEWKAELRLPGFASEEKSVFRDMLPQRRAAADGQIGVFNASDGIFGVGLLTGRRLWVRPYETPLNGDLVPYRDTLVAAGDGYVAGMPRNGRLTLMRGVDGTTVWERDLRSERVAHIWMDGDRLITADPLLQRLHIFDRADGHLIERVLFQQPDPRTSLVRLVRTEGILCGPRSDSQTQAVVGLDLTSGETVWRAELDKPVYELFVVEPGRIGVGLLGGGVRILNANDGEVLLDRHYSRGLPITHGLLLDGTLIAQAERRQGQLRIPELVAIDVATGEEVWNRTDLTALPNEPPGPIRVVAGTIPTLVDATRTTLRNTGRTVRSHSIALTMIDVKTGLDSGAPQDLPSPATGARINRDFAVRPGMIAVGSDRWLHAYRLEQTDSARTDGF